MRAAIVAAVVSLLLVAAQPGTAAPNDLVIANSGYGVSVLGPMRPRVDAKMATAIRLFGADFLAPAGCRFIWPAIGLSVQGESFAAGDPCAFVQLVRISGPRSHRWRTARGLRVGSTLSTLRRLYPRASRHGVVWWLTTSRSPFGHRVTVPIISAVVINGRVIALRGFVGGAGE